MLLFAVAAPVRRTVCMASENAAQNVQPWKTIRCIGPNSLGLLPKNKQGDRFVDVLLDRYSKLT